MSSWRARLALGPMLRACSLPKNVQRMYLRAEDRSRYYYNQSTDARARVEELEGQLVTRVAQDEQRQTALAQAQAQVE